MDPITLAPFALDVAAPEGDYILRRGKIFNCGNYPDKGFSLTPDEARAAIAAFTPVALDLEHISTPLDGKLGELRDVVMGADGWTLEGTVALPAWLDTALGSGAKKVSCTWDKTSKRLLGLALVNNPRVDGAALMSAYAAFAGKRHSATDQSQVQAIHDSATALGAVCADDAEPVLDDGVPDGVTMPGRPPGVGYSKPAMTGGRKRMNLKEWLTGKAKEDGVELDDSVNFGSPPPDPRVAVLEAELASQRATFTAKAQADRVADAARFADAEVAALHILPAGRDALVALYASAAEQDAAGSTVTFANGESHTHVAALTAVFAALPSHMLTQQMALTPEQQVLMARSTPNPDGPMSPERRKQLLNLTPLGQAVANNGSH